MTMIRQYLPQTQTLPYVYPSNHSYGPHDSVPTTPRTATRRALMAHDQNASRRPQFSQQYAHPLQRNNSYPQPSSSKSVDNQAVAHPEHMLRRKTPNGILAAAYDGTSVEQVDKPHAMKHILLPLKTSDARAANHPMYSYGLQQELPLRSPAIMNHTGHDRTKQAPFAGSSWDQSDITGNYDGKTDNWKMLQHNIPQLDSMLNQMPTHHAQLTYQQIYCGAMQPPLQSPLGPTVSNDQGPFGPYWPNGQFIPYRPAALRDARYYSNAPAWAVHPHDSFANRAAAADWQALNGMVPNGSAIHPAQQFQSNASLAMLPHNANLPPLNNVVAQGYRSADGMIQQSPYRPAFGDMQVPVAPVNYGFAPPRTTQEQYYAPVDSAKITNRLPQTPIPTSLADFGPYSSNAELREKVFTWAHSIYIDLLKHLQQTRRQNSHRHASPHHATRPSIYPKPPRQSSNNLSTPHVENHRSDDASSSNAESSRRGSSQVVDRSAISLQNPGLGWSSSHIGGTSPLRPHDSWGRAMSDKQVTTLQQPHASDKLRTLRRSSGSILGGTMPGSVDPSSSQVASTALELMTQLCADNAWKWVDGMLLVGCLAYALGDFNKAYGWYTKIMELDPK
jgi:hypothetical protein